MPFAVRREVLELGLEVDRLGQEGLTQEQIAQKLGRSSKWVLRNELRESGLELAVENRVRFAANGERLADLANSGQIIPSAPAEVAVP